MEQFNPIDKLFSYQKTHIQQLLDAIIKSNCVLDGSDTGTGKTYTTIGLCYLLNLKPFIICPKSTITNWVNVAKDFNVEIIGLANYEKIKNCKYFTCRYENSECPFIEKDGKNYSFILPVETLIVVDEAHKCKNHKTINSKFIILPVINA